MEKNAGGYRGGETGFDDRDGSEAPAVDEGVNGGGGYERAEEAVEFFYATRVIVIVRTGGADAEGKAIESDEETEAEGDHKKSAGPADRICDLRDQAEECNA